MCKWKRDTNISTVYLFNSAFRGTYAFNLFKIMASQKGLYAKIRYAIKKNVPPELREQINYRKLENHPCFIIFINRYSDKNYEFLPIRKGEITRTYTESEYLFIDVKLDDYITANAGVSEFTRLLYDKLKGKNIPELKDNNPEITADGNYIIESNENIEKNIISNSDSWLASVEYLSKTKAFGEMFGFIKLRLCKIEKGNRHTVMVPDGNGIISISPHCNCVVEATYFDPTLGKGNFLFNVNFQNPLLGMQRKIYCTSKIDNISVSVSCGNNISWGDKPCLIELFQAENNVDHCILAIPCKINPIWKDNIIILLVCMVLVLAFGSELEQSKNLWMALKWLISLILIVYTGVKVF